MGRLWGDPLSDSDHFNGSDKEMKPRCRPAGSEVCLGFLDGRVGMVGCRESWLHECLLCPSGFVGGGIRQS